MTAPTAVKIQTCWQEISDRVTKENYIPEYPQFRNAYSCWETEYYKVEKTFTVLSLGMCCRPEMQKTNKKVCSLGIRNGKKHLLNLTTVMSNSNNPEIQTFSSQYYSSWTKTQIYR